MNAKTLGLAAALLASTFVVVQPVQAQSVRDRIVAMIKDGATAAGAKDVTVNNVTGDDSRFTIGETTATTETDGRTTTFTAGPTTYVGAKIAPDGGYTINQIDATDVNIEEEESSFSIDAVKVTNYLGQALDKARANNFMGDRFDRLEMTGISLEEASGPNITAQSLVMTTGGDIGGLPSKGSLEVKAIVLPVDESNDQQKALADLGYKELNIDLSAFGSFDEKSKRLSLDNLLIGGQSVGKFSLSLAFGNVTADALQQLRAAQDDNAKQLEVMQAFTLDGLTIRLENDSIVDRMLDNQAKQQGVARADLVKGLSEGLGPMLAAINNPATSQKVQAAVDAFLKAPKSLSVSIKPANPVPFAQLVAVAGVAPQTLPDLLGFDIVANR
jgi:hypothetical protein